MAALSKGKNPYSSNRLVSLGKWCSATEQVAERAEKAVLEIKKYRYLEQRLKSGEHDVYNGVVVSILNFGVFIELIEIQAQGLLRLDAFPGGHIAMGRGRKTLVFGNRRLGVGSTLKVIVSAVDSEKKQIDLSPAEDMPKKRAAGSQRGRKAGNKKLRSKEKKK